MPATRSPDWKPERGDVVIFRLPRDPAVLYVKRLIGMPGDRVQVIKGRLTLNGKTIPRTEAGSMPDPNDARRQVPVYRELPNGTSYWIVETGATMDRSTRRKNLSCPIACCL